MDIVGKETLEKILTNYEGTVLFVSHDRYFIQKIADSLLVFEKNKGTYYPFGYQEYTEKGLCSDEVESSIKFTVQTKVPKKVPSGKDEERKEQAIRKLERSIVKIEKEIGSDLIP